MKKIILLTSITIFSWLGWWLGDRMGIMTAYLLSFVGSLVGVYLGIRLNRDYLGRAPRFTGSSNSKTPTQLPLPGILVIYDGYLKVFFRIFKFKLSSYFCANLLDYGISPTLSLN